jgi:hypothetical protein
MLLFITWKLLRNCSDIAWKIGTHVHVQQTYLNHILTKIFCNIEMKSLCTHNKTDSSPAFLQIF